MDYHFDWSGLKKTHRTDGAKNFRKNTWISPTLYVVTEYIIHLGYDEWLPDVVPYQLDQIQCFFRLDGELYRVGFSVDPRCVQLGVGWRQVGYNLSFSEQFPHGIHGICNCIDGQEGYFTKQFRHPGDYICVNCGATGNGIRVIFGKESVRITVNHKKIPISMIPMKDLTFSFEDTIIMNMFKIAYGK